MAPIRVLFLLVAIAAASAGKIPAGQRQLAPVSRALTVDAHIHVLQSELSTQIATLQGSRHVTKSIIDKAIKKLNELVSKIKERLSLVEHELIDAAESISAKILGKINDFIKNKTGVDLDLVAKWEKFESKTQKCTASLKSDVREILLQIRTETLTCADKQLSEIKLIGQQILDLADVLEVVPAKTVKNIKACVSAKPTPPPTEAPTTLAPEPTETDAPVTSTDADSPAPSDAPASETTEDETSQSPVTEPASASVTPDSDEDDSDEADDETEVAVFKHGRGRLGSWSSKWKTVVCVTKELTQGFKDLEAVPELIYKLVREVSDVASKESQQKLEQCSEQSVAGKGEQLQKVIAELAYCVIAPPQQ